MTIEEAIAVVEEVFACAQPVSEEAEYWTMTVNDYQQEALQMVLQAAAKTLHSKSSLVG